jgi:hypothetical protein
MEMIPFGKEFIPSGQGVHITFLKGVGAPFELKKNLVIHPLQRRKWLGFTESDYLMILSLLLYS